MSVCHYYLQHLIKLRMNKKCIFGHVMHELRSYALWVSCTVRTTNDGWTPCSLLSRSLMTSDERPTYTVSQKKRQYNFAVIQVRLIQSQWVKYAGEQRERQVIWNSVLYSGEMWCAVSHNIHYCTGGTDKTFYWMISFITIWWHIILKPKSSQLAHLLCVEISITKLNGHYSGVHIKKYIGTLSWHLLQSAEEGMWSVEFFATRLHFLWEAPTSHMQMIAV